MAGGRGRAGRGHQVGLDFPGVLAGRPLLAGLPEQGRLDARFARALAQAFERARAHGVGLGRLLVRPVQPVGGHGQQALRPHQALTGHPALLHQRGQRSVFVSRYSQDIVFRHCQPF